MTLDECIATLTEHNKWRRGEAPYDSMGVDSPCTPMKLGDVIEYAIEELQARARVGKGEVETHITDMAIAHDMSHTAFCDEGYWRDEFISAQEKAIAALPAKPVEVGELKPNQDVVRHLSHKHEYVNLSRDFIYGLVREYLIMDSRTTDTELTRLRKQVEVLSNCLVAIKKHSIRHNEDDYIINNAEQALAAADRIAKGEV